MASTQVPHAPLARAIPKGRESAARRQGPRGRVCPGQPTPLTFDERARVPNAEGAVGEHSEEMLTVGRETGRPPARACG